MNSPLSFAVIVGQQEEAEDLLDHVEWFRCRKVCKNCRCSKEEHDIHEEDDVVVPRIGRLFDNRPEIKERYAMAIGQHDRDHKVIQLHERYEWLPPAATSDLMQRYMTALPSEARPIKGSDGSRYRRRQLERQLPFHDIDAAKCDRLTDEERIHLKEFFEQTKKEALGVGVVTEIPAGAHQDCGRCNANIAPGDIAVHTERLPADWWHPVCFVCEECGHLLVDLIHFAHSGKVFCGRHYAEKLKPRCAACDELIFSTYTRAEEQNWHLKHFCCWQCDLPLGGHKYIAKDAKPFCLRCFERLFPSKCEACHQKIKAESPRIRHERLSWHPSCFCCTRCHRALAGLPFAQEQGMLICGTRCRQRAAAAQPRPILKHC